MRLIDPIKDSRCAVVIPTHKCTFSPIERYCIEVTVKALSCWDVYLLFPEGFSHSDFRHLDIFNFIPLSGNFFESTDSYNRLRVSRIFHELFFSYDRMLVVEPDAIVFSDDILSWHQCDFDYIGAPWFGALSLTSNFHTLPDLLGLTFQLEVGNGGLCLLNPRSIAFLLSKYSSLLGEFLLRKGPQAHSDAFLAFLGVIDKNFKIAPPEVAAKFSLELDARRAILKQGRLPMGFHAMYKYDPDLWRHLFPMSPTLL